MQSDEMDSDGMAARIGGMSPIHELSDEEKSFASDMASSTMDHVDSLSTNSEGKPYRGSISTSSSDEDSFNISSPRRQRQNLNRSFATPDRRFTKRNTPSNTAISSPKKKLQFERMFAGDEDSSGTLTGGEMLAESRRELGELRASNFDADKSFLSSAGDLNDSFVSSFGGGCGSHLSSRKIAGYGAASRHDCSISPISSPVSRMHALKLRDNVPSSPFSIVKQSMNARSRNPSNASTRKLEMSDELNDSHRDISLDSSMVGRKLKHIMDESGYETSGELSPGTDGPDLSINEIAGVTTKNTKRSLDNSFEARPQQLQPSPMRLSGNDDRASKKRAASSGVSRLESDFQYERTLGRGAFGIVLLYRNLLDGQSYAIKKLVRPRRGSVDEKRALMEVWAHAWPGSCKHLVRYYSAWVEATSMYVQNEYCNGGSLEAFLQTRREIAAQQHLAGGYQLQEAELAQILLHVAAALHDMHRRKIAHLDVKPANIFLCRAERSDADAARKPCGSIEAGAAHTPTSAATTDFSATTTDGVTYKLGDLGRVMSFRDMELSGASGSQSSDNNGVVVIDEGDSRYMAPELLRWRYASVEKADIYSLGLSVYEAAGCGPLPKSGSDWEDLRQNPSKLHLPQCSSAFNSLLQKLIAVEPADRPSASDILKHPTLVPEKTSDELKRELNAARFDNHILSRQLKEYEKLAAFYHRTSPSATALFSSNTAPVCWATSLHAATTSSALLVPPASDIQGGGAFPASSPVIRTGFCPPQPHRQHYLMGRPRLPVPQQLNERYAVYLPSTAVVGLPVVPSPEGEAENHTAFMHNNILRPFLKIKKPSTKTLCHANSCTY